MGAISTPSNSTGSLLQDGGGGGGGHVSRAPSRGAISVARREVRGCAIPGIPRAGRPSCLPVEWVGLHGPLQALDELLARLERQGGLAALVEDVDRAPKVGPVGRAPASRKRETRRDGRSTPQFPGRGLVPWCPTQPAPRATGGVQRCADPAPWSVDSRAVEHRVDTPVELLSLVARVAPPHLLHLGVDFVQRVLAGVQELAPATPWGEEREGQSIRILVFSFPR